MMGKAKGTGEKVKGWLRRLRLVAVLGPCAGGLVPFPFAAKSFAQTPQAELPAPLSARTISPRFDRLNLEDGLSQSQISDIYQDRHGFMWFATQDGLNRWDGHEFKIYYHEPFDSTTLSSSWVNNLTEDPQGFLWVSTEDGGLNRFDPVSEEFTSYRTSARRFYFYSQRQGR